jgi:uncharacterized protein
MRAEVDPRTGLEQLDEGECLRLLGHCALGRLAVVLDARPVVFPVNFALDGRAVVFRTNEGTKLYAARHGVVAFECDAVDRVYRTGWSVLVSGDAELVDDPAETARLERLPLAPWSAAPKPVWVRIRPRTITGRRIPPPGSDRAGAQMADIVL